MALSDRAIDINASTRKIEVDNRFSLHYYRRIADNLLRQASIYREEKNDIDLYIMLLRYSSLTCETIPSHRDYRALLPKEKTALKKKLLDILNELESLKPVVQCQVDELNRGVSQSDDIGKLYYSSATSKQFSRTPSSEQPPTTTPPQSFRKHNNECNQITSSENLKTEMQFQRLSLSLPHPKEETLSRHSILGPNGLRGKWTGPITGIRVQYPSNDDFAQTEIQDINQDGDYGSISTKEGDARGITSDLASVLSLDDGRWSVPTQEPWSLATNAKEEFFSLLNVRQPSVPPVLGQVQPQLHAISQSRVADPRPGPAKLSKDGIPDTKEYKKLHIPVKMMDCFLRLAEMNTMKNLETCGVLAGSLKNRTFYVTTLIIPKQESTSDSCQTTDEEEIFNVQDERSLFPLGWIHTHPTQTCFMSSIDLHTHYSYQIMLPEAIAIVMAPTDTSRTHGIFHLSDPSGVSLIRNCQERGFHPHEEPPDGSPIYEHCSHVNMNVNMDFDVVDLRNP